MTEEIIIDCAFYKDGVCASPINKTCEYCKNIDVSKCYHKQLKRLEQENKELKGKADHFEMANDIKKQEIDALREQAELDSNAIDEFIKDISKYKSALEEISGLASPHCTQCSQIINIIKEVLQ